MVRRDEKNERWSVAQHLRAFGSGPVLHLHPVASRDMLLSCDSEGVNAHSLPRFRLKGQAARTRGCSTFAWDDGSSTLCVAMKRR